MSHHPPVAAIHYEASDGSWTCWEEVAVNCKFRGKYLEVCPLGIIHVFFPGSENHYTFPKVRRGRAVQWWSCVYRHDLG